MDGFIEELQVDDIIEFSAFIKRVFDEFVSKDYCDEGNNTFYNYINQEAIITRKQNGNLFLIYRIDKEIIGGIELKDLNHISLLFVDKKYHNHGIGRELIKRIVKYIKTNGSNIKEIEVNSSPYAKDIYKHIGFKQIAPLREKNGIKYIEMRYTIE